MHTPLPPVADGYVRIFTPSVFRNGKLYLAKDYGKEAWCFDVTEVKHLNYLKKRQAKAKAN